MTTTSFTNIEFGATGIQHGHAQLVQSDNAHDAAIIPVPVSVISSGPGPTALLVAGTHGDEYEGQIALQSLLRSIRPEQLDGTVIIVPAANAPAVRGGSRVSPLDGGNLNRQYPGDERGGPTAQLAQLISRELLPRADSALDLHSGGTQSTYLSCAFLYRGPTESLWREKVQIARSLGFPFVMVVAERMEPGSFNSAGDDAGIPVVATELGGGGTIDLQSLGMIRTGLRRYLADAGVLTRPLVQPPRADKPAQWMELIPESTVTATMAGLFEPAVGLGGRVSAGDRVARIHSIDEPDRAPKDYFAAIDGIVAVVRRPTLVAAGSHLVHIARPLPAPAH